MFVDKVEKRIAWW